MTSVLDRPAPPPDLTIPYGPHPEQVIDLRLPPQIRDPASTAPPTQGQTSKAPPTRGQTSKAPPTRGQASKALPTRGQASKAPPTRGQASKAPLIVLIHGGFWRPAYDRRHLGPMASALAAAGYVVAVPEYRRAGMAEEGWTGPFTDVAAALDQVAGMAASYGADISQVTWAGHSAGGHLALWAAARPGLPAGSPWRRFMGPGPATHVVSLAGCSSLRLCAEWDLGAGAVRLLMGGGPDDVPERYAVADPAALPAPSVPVTLVHGTDDNTVPLRMSQAFTAGRLVEIPGAGHYDLIDPQRPAWPTVLSVLAGTGCEVSSP